jgi:hypothetical protein
MIVMLLMVDKKYMKKTLIDKLTPDLQVKYQNRVNERRGIYLFGFTAGLIISLMTLFILKQSIKMDGMRSACYVVALTFIITSLYYTLAPKSDLLVVEIDDLETRKAWMEIYNYMKWNYHVSIILGVLVAGFLGYGLCA